MMEIIHDVAPGASQAFHTAFEPLNETLQIAEEANHAASVALACLSIGLPDFRRGDERAAAGGSHRARLPDCSEQSSVQPRAPPKGGITRRR